MDSAKPLRAKAATFDERANTARLQVQTLGGSTHREKARRANRDARGTTLPARHPNEP